MRALFSHEVHLVYPNGVIELSPGLRGRPFPIPTELPWVKRQKETINPEGVADAA